MPQRLLLILCVTTACLCIALFAGAWDASVPAPPPIADEQFDEADGPAGLERAEFAWRDGAREDYDGELAEAGLDRTSVLSDGEGRPAVTLQVWDGKRGTPAAGAEVFVLDGRDAWRGGWGRWRGGRGGGEGFDLGPYERVEEQGVRFVAGDDGRVMLPGAEWRAIVVARTPGRFGTSALRRDQRDEEIVLGVDETVVVRVIGADGRPAAGVPVAIQQREPQRVDARAIENELAQQTRRLTAERELQAKGERNDVSRLQAFEARVAALEQRAAHLRDLAQRQQQQREQAAQARGQAAPEPGPVIETSWDVRARRFSDERGEAVFRHFQLRRREPEKWWPKAHADRFEAVLVMPLGDAPRVAFAGRPLDETIELRMPAVGSLALRTVDVDGRPFTHPVHADLRVVDGPNPGWTRRSLRKDQNEEAIVFPFVGLGLSFEARCRLDDDDFRWRSPVFVGPMHPGEHVTIDLVVAPDAGMLHGRVLYQNGSPLVDERVTFLINSTLGRMEGEEVRLDRDGRFHLPYLMPRGHQAPFRLQVRHEGREPVPGVALPLPALPLGRVSDLGELRLDSFDCIAFGRVVDDRGEPIAGASVQLQRERVTGRNGDEVGFRDEAFTDTATDDLGEFALFGDVEPARYRLVVRARDHFGYESSSLPGPDGALIELVRHANFVGRVKLPEWVDRREVDVRFESETDPRNSDDGRLFGGRGAYGLRSDDLRPGSYVMTMRMDRLPEPFLRIAGLRLEPGAREAHPRLANLDLSNALFRYEVRAVDQEGKPVTPRSPLLAHVVRADGTMAWAGFPWRRGRTEIVAATPTIEVRGVDVGTGVVQEVLAPGESVLRFVKAPMLQLQFDGLPELLGDERMWVSIEPVEALEVASWDRDSERVARDVRRVANGHARLGADGRAGFAAMPAGRYRVIARMGERRGGMVSTAIAEVVVPEPMQNVEGRPIRVAFDADVVRAALRQVATRRAAAAGGR